MQVDFIFVIDFYTVNAIEHLSQHDETSNTCYFSWLPKPWWDWQTLTLSLIVYALIF